MDNGSVKESNGTAHFVSTFMGKDFVLSHVEHSSELAAQLRVIADEIESWDRPVGEVELLNGKLIVGLKEGIVQ